MEVLLFALFMLFSIVSSLLERRKRAKQLEEAREAERVRGPQAPETKKEQEEEEPQTLGWPFGGGSDPFEEEVVSRRVNELKPEKPAEPRSLSMAEQHQLEADREAMEAEKRALEVERYALAAERLGQERLVPRLRVSDLVREKMQQEKAQAKPRRSTRGKRWRLDRKKAREAIVYAEILGPPKANREEIR